MRRAVSVSFASSAARAAPVFLDVERAGRIGRRLAAEHRDHRIRRRARRGDRIGPTRRRDARHAAVRTRAQAERPLPVAIGRGVAHDHRDVAERLAQRVALRVGVVAGLAQHREHAFARGHRDAAGAQALGDEIHAAEPHPRLFGAVRSGQRQHQRGLRARGMQRRGAYRGRSRRLAHARREESPQPRDDEHGGDRDDQCDARARPRGRRRRLRRQFDDEAVRPRHRRERRIGETFPDVIGNGVGEDQGDRLRRCDPAIAEARHRRYRMLRGAVVVDRAARAQHELAELHVGHVDAAVHGRRELVAADGALALLDEIHEQIEHAPRTRHGLAVARQFARRGVQPESTEAVDRRLRKHSVVRLRLRSFGPRYSVRGPRNHSMRVQPRHTKHVALRLAQARSNNSAKVVLSFALRLSKRSPPQCAQTSARPATLTRPSSSSTCVVITSMVFGSNMEDSSTAALPRPSKYAAGGAIRPGPADTAQ
ncbi:hypothetical protein OD750_006710 [Tahibacter sp. BL]|uniref:Uncharacterized protein n=1 Tax=Tahibacter soli TaxID=2983605 RepID=A0A9X4BH12_9GAMM|nr:hypothetical protein [Tahibacter soli]MDC8012236.1 hypothetical protein [Tahibacter soli]